MAEIGERSTCLVLNHSDPAVLLETAAADFDWFVAELHA